MLSVNWSENDFSLDFRDDLLSMKTPPTSESRPKVNSSVTVAVDTTPPATVKKRLNSTPKTSPRVGGKSEVDKLLSVTPSKDVRFSCRNDFRLIASIV